MFRLFIPRGCRVRKDHPLCTIREMVDEVLSRFRNRFRIVDSRCDDGGSIRAGALTAARHLSPAESTTGIRRG